MKRFAALLLALGLLCSLTATAESPVNLTVFHYMAQTCKQQGLLAIEEAYAELHPNVTFTNIYYNQGTDYFAQLATALTSGEQPDIIMGNPGMYPDLVTEGFAMDLTDNAFIQGLNLSTGDLGDVSSGGRIYAFPIDFKTWGIFYNKTIFDSLGLGVPTTLTELNELQQKLIDAGIDPYVRSLDDAIYGDMWVRSTVWSRAIELGDKDIFEKLMSGEKKLTDYPYYAEALQNWVYKMVKPRPDDMTNTQEMALAVFASGGAAMRFDGNWAIGDIISKNPQFEIGFFLPPIDDNHTTRMNLLVDQSFMVNPQAENTDIAIDFLEYWIQDGVAWSEISQMPLLTGTISDKLSPLVKDLIDMRKNGPIAQYGDLTKPYSSAFTNALRKQLTSFAENRLSGGSMTVEQCLAAIQDAFDELILLNR